MPKRYSTDLTYIECLHSEALLEIRMIELGQKPSEAAELSSTIWRPYRIQQLMAERPMFNPMWGPTGG